MSETPPGELWYYYFTVTNSKYRVRWSSVLSLRLKHEVIYIFNITSIAATEKRPLSYKTPQSLHRPRYCGVQTFPLEMHYGGEKLRENWGRSGRILTPNERFLTFGVPVYCVKFHQNWERFATIGEVTDRRTDRHTDKSDFIICPMLCYSNGTDNYVLYKFTTYLLLTTMHQ